MPVCDQCGNEYAKAFKVDTHDGQSHTFDSIECLAQMMAPRCGHCDCRILGHGIEAGSAMFCCANCAREGGATGAVDNTTRGA